MHFIINMTHTSRARFGSFERTEDTPGHFLSLQSHFNMVDRRIIALWIKGL